MGNYTREEILQMAEEEDVEFIRLQFTDMFGTLKNIAITARELPRALDNRCIVDGSFIAGIAGESEPDMYLRPDLDTFAILPWRPQQGKVARLLCDIYCPDGTPHERSPRYILKKTAREAKKEGYTCLVDPDCEFFLFHTDDNGILIRELGGGKYCIFTVAHTTESIQQAWSTMFTNISTLGYTIDFSRPIIERYAMKMIRKHLAKRKLSLKH